MSSNTAPKRVARPRRPFWSSAHGWVNWVYLLPAAFFFFVYMAYPILRSLWISFTDYQFIVQTPAKFVGLQELHQRDQGSGFLDRAEARGDFYDRSSCRA